MIPPQRRALQPPTDMLRVIIALLPILAATGCSSGYAPPVGGGAKAEISESAVLTYLSKADLARPEIVRAVWLDLRAGRGYRRRVRDQSNKWCLATVWLDGGNTLHVVTCRNETCPKCRGTGKRTWSNQHMQDMPFSTRCLKCDGKGFLEHYTVERKYVLSPMDFENPAAAGAGEQARYSQAPPQARRYVEMLVDSAPRKRLQACLWLDRNYVRLGDSFRLIAPMLRKARQRDRNRKVMVWQFRAGQGVAGEEDRAYYRVYAHTKSGKIFKKGFYPAR